MSKSIEAEQSVIGCLLLYGLEAAELITKLDDDDFSDIYLKLTFQEIRRLGNEGSHIDIISASQALKEKDMSYLTELVEHAPAIDIALNYVEILKKHSLARKLKGVAVGLEELCNDDPKEALLYAQNKLIEFTQEKKDQQESLKQTLKRVVNDMQEDFERDGMSGIPTGISEIDNKLDGLQKQTLTVLSGVSGAGKTTLGMNIALKACEKAPVLFVSMEMSKSQLVKRMLSSLSNVTMNKVMSPRKMGTEDWPKLTTGVNKAMPLNERLVIDDSPMCSPAYIRMKANEVKLKYGHLGLVVIDYFRLLESQKGEKTLEATTNNAIAINRLKKELDVPIVLLAQLNKDVVKSGRRPNQGDLDWGQQLNRDADNIFFLYVDDSMEEDQVINLYSDKTRDAEGFNTYLRNELQFNRLTDLSFQYQEKESQGFTYN